MLELARPIRSLDDLQLIVDGGLSPTRLRGMRDALLMRLGHPPTAAALEWQGRSLQELGRACLDAKGVPLRNLGRMELAAYALNLTRSGPSGYLTTSDLPAILAQVGRAQLAAGYQAAPRTFTRWCRQGALPDFRTVNKVSLGLGPKFLKVPEHGEYPRGPLPSTVATAQLAKYGRVLAFTREAMVNDDVGLFERIPTLLGNAAAAMEGDVVYGILVGNPTMPDGAHVVSAAAHRMPRRPAAR